MPWKNFLLALFISVYAFKEWELKSPNSNRHQGRSFLLEKQDYKINDDWHLIKGWESHQQWQGTEWNVECTFLSKGSSTNDFPKRQKYPEFHVNVPSFKYWQFIQGSKFTCKTLWGNTVLGVLWPLSQNLRLTAPLASLQTLSEVHNAGTQAGWPAAFTVKRGRRNRKSQNIHRSYGRAEDPLE